MKISKDAIKAVLAADTAQQITERARENTLGGCSMCATHDCNRCRSGALGAAQAEMNKMRSELIRSTEGAARSQAREGRASLLIISDKPTSSDPAVARKIPESRASNQPQNKQSVNAPISSTTNSTASAGSQSVFAAQVGDGNSISKLVATLPPRIQVEEVVLNHAQRNSNRVNLDYEQARFRDVVQDPANGERVNLVRAQASDLHDGKTSQIAATASLDSKDQTSRRDNFISTDVIVAGAPRKEESNRLQVMVEDGARVNTSLHHKSKSDGHAETGTGFRAGRYIREQKRERKMSQSKARFLSALDKLSRKIGHVSVNRRDSAFPRVHDVRKESIKQKIDIIRPNKQERSPTAAGSVKESRRGEVPRNAISSTIKPSEYIERQAIRSLVQKELRVAIRAEIREVVKREVKNLFAPDSVRVVRRASEGFNVMRRQDAAPVTRRLNKQLEKLGSSERRLVEQLLDQMLRKNQTPRVGKKRSDSVSLDGQVAMSEENSSALFSEEKSGSVLAEAAEQDSLDFFASESSNDQEKEQIGREDPPKNQNVMVSSAQSGPKSNLETTQSIEQQT